MSLKEVSVFRLRFNGMADCLPASYTQPISTLDIVATAAAAAGVSLPSDRPYDGLNLLPFLTGEQTKPARTLFWRVFGLGSTGPPASQSTIWQCAADHLSLSRKNPPLISRRRFITYLMIQAKAWICSQPTSRCKRTQHPLCTMEHAISRASLV